MHHWGDSSNLSNSLACPCITRDICDEHSGFCSSVTPGSTHCQGRGQCSLPAGSPLQEPLLQSRGLTQPPAMAMCLPFASRCPHTTGRFWKHPPPSKAQGRCFATSHPSTAGKSHTMLKRRALCQAHAKHPIQATELAQQDKS